MLLRNLVWRMHERLGDGGALAAVLAQALFESSVRFVAAGANPILVLSGMKQGAQAALAHLLTLSQPVQGEEDLAAVANSVTGQPELSWMLGEMFDLLGPLAYVTVEEYAAPYLERVYLDGGCWQAGLISPYLINSPIAGRAVLPECQVLLYDGSLSSAQEVRPLLELVSGYKPPHVLIAAQRIGEEALTMLVGTSQQTEMKIIAVSLKRAGAKAHADLHDLSLLTGAALISPETGRKLEGVRPEDLGRARRAEASAEELLVFGGGGQASETRRQIELLQRQLQALPIGDDGRGEIELRLGRLSGSAGILKIGAHTQSERDFLRQKAEQGIKVLRVALEEGVIVGGGAAYLHCISSVQSKLASLQGDEAMGARAVIRALEAPFRAILHNARTPAPGVILEQILQKPPGFYYDVVAHQVVEARRYGVLDSARVVRAALETAVSGAAMALSTEILVLKKNPKVSYEP
jgi:chaperonin GroEL